MSRHTIRGCQRRRLAADHPGRPDRLNNMEPSASESSRSAGRTRFNTEMDVRPDDIDMFQHVHSSRYLDYVLAARFDQMTRCYGLGMDEFLKLGLAWYQRAARIEFKRPLRLGDRFNVTTWVDAMDADSVSVGFEIRRLEDQKLCCDGMCRYTLVNVASGRVGPTH